MGKGIGKGWKIGLSTAICLALAGGAVGAATAHNWRNPDASASQISPATPTPTAAAVPVSLGMTPSDGTTFVNPAAPGMVKAANGTLSKVILKVTKTGENIDGSLSADAGTWTSSGELTFDTNYTYDVTAVDTAGFETHKQTTFTTVPPSHEADAAVYPGGKFTVGVGQPIEINFSEPVTNKAAVEKAIKITTSAGQVGAFHWYSDTMVRFRPEDFWAANSQVTVAMNLFGVNFGEGQIGNFNKTVTIPIGDKLEMVADAANHVADVYINGALAKHFQVTMGDERFPSASGYLVILNDKQRKAHFVASTIGLKPDDPANYGELDVNYATRLTPSGEFIHQATDSAVPYIGRVNLSHGCVGMNEDGASWVFNNMGMGDIVKVVNSPAENIAPTDGFGDWNIPWGEYAN